MTNKKQLSKEPYKGMRDFYPDDMHTQQNIFEMWRVAMAGFGYSEYSAPILEETDLYRAKSGEELVGEQTYSFTDRGDRDVTIRPEMTPSLARLVARKQKELSFPLRWFSIPNLYRYERPQRGRLREHWQLNVDLFGEKSMYADAEIIMIAQEILAIFDLPLGSFEIRLNSRKLMDEIFLNYLGLTEEEAYKTGKLVDRKEKMESDAFSAATKELIGEKSKQLAEILDAQRITDLPGVVRKTEGAQELIELFGICKKLGVKNISYSSSLMRGFDYYTGPVFEVFDTNPVNKRSLG